MVYIRNSTASQFIQKNLFNKIKEITESTERLSSGKRVNNASDDPGSIGTISRLSWLTMFVQAVLVGRRHDGCSAGWSAGQGLAMAGLAACSRPAKW